MKFDLDKKVSLGWVAITGIGCLALGFGISDMGAKIFKFEWEWETVMAGALGLAGGWLAYMGAMTPFTKTDNRKRRQLRHQLNQLVTALEGETHRILTGGQAVTVNGENVTVTMPPKAATILERLPATPYEIAETKLLDLYDNLFEAINSYEEESSDPKIEAIRQRARDVIDHINKHLDHH
ncbi:hypothetical protein [Thalassospira mesophila]|uniref:Uncharacterized protein n=1 Tax=Thalassospira mesophila TaxID=1293891 RepID=A0A1Y2L3W5_9PROT|nr:hypothetical protein [Thalassospira mesophila]OSQ38993.1 hypothetical protein TMES_09865 [Thalassospira mesophila]